MTDWAKDIIYNVKVNRTGKQIPVRESVAYNAPQVGLIYPNELFSVGNIANEELALYSIRFRNSAGNIASGVIYARNNDENVAEKLNIYNYALFTKVIDGKTYYGFKMRRSEELYDGNAKKLSVVAPSGRCILCERSTCGVNYPEWLAAQYLETKIDSGTYYRPTPGTMFVDIGYDKGSTFTSNSSIRGSL